MSRPVRLVRSQPDMVAGSVNAELFEGHTEHHLYHVVEQLRPEVKMDMTVPAFLQVCEGLSEPIHEYFDKVNHCLYCMISVFCCKDSYC